MNIDLKFCAMVDMSTNYVQNFPPFFNILGGQPELAALGAHDTFSYCSMVVTFNSAVGQNSKRKYMNIIWKHEAAKKSVCRKSPLIVAKKLS